VNERSCKRFSRLPVGNCAPRWSADYLVLSPLELIEKLAALVPPPRLNLVQYVFGGVSAVLRSTD
jgi:hypothetical protein